MNNPLRYPGAKSKLSNYVIKLIKTEKLVNCTFLEPYAGSAAISFKLLEEKIIKKAIINEKDPLIFSFWYSVFNHTDELIQKIRDTEINLENWNFISQYRNIAFIKNQPVVEIGFAGLFLNRTNFSGILKAGPLGGKCQLSEYKIDCRFNKESIINSIVYFASFKNNIEVYNLDAIEFMRQKTKYKRNNKLFVYIDPPYFEKGKSLYRYFYEADDHMSLANYIKSKSFPWLISYDKTEFIENLYPTNNFINLYLDYSAKTSKKGCELLISNLEIPPIENQTQLIKDIN